jgi:XrtJ-associated TM-motif-TM protein
MQKGLARIRAAGMLCWTDEVSIRFLEVVVKKYRAILPVAVLLLAATVRLHAQDIDGCTDSPENPTLVLGLIVSAASVGYVQARRYLRVRNHRKDQ